MARIEKLSASVVNRIAAGEVVERPASVVKELLENALDSMPTRIDLALEQGGIALVRVVDNGGGIEPEDLQLAVAPHATSKLRIAEDLERINTLGFRGEALASIGEVARLIIQSRPPDGSGASIEVDRGQVGEVTPCGGGVGTVVEVHQLFSNVPARRAFLRAASTEWSHSSEAFVRTALAHPAVAFSLTHNGRCVHELPVAATWRIRIGGLFGTALSDNLIEVEASDGEIALHGLVSRPENDMASSRMQHLFVSGRPFRDRSILHAVQEAYRGVLLSGRQPIVFLRFTLPADMVDVNVHPAKMEVRFREPSRLYRLVLSALRTQFLSSDMRTHLKPPTGVATAPWFGSPQAAGSQTAADFSASLFSAADVSFSGATSLRADPAWEQRCTAPEASRDAELAVQMHDRYIIVESDAGIEVIDQHALHERVLYEQLKSSLADGVLEVQPLLIPERIDLTPAEIELLTEHSATLAQAGMRVEPFGGPTVIVTSKPVLAGSTPAAAIVHEVLDRLSSSSAQASKAMLIDEVLHSLACRAAIKAGDALSQTEVDALVRGRHTVHNSHHCPHGRPTILTLSRQELDRQFRRT